MLGFGAFYSAQRFCRAFEECGSTFVRGAKEAIRFTGTPETTVCHESTKTRVDVPRWLTSQPDRNPLNRP
jgi:hypothetical protein